MASLVQGRIVYCHVADPQGRNPKIRPIILVDLEPEKIPLEEPLHGVCLTTQVGEASREDCIPVPWHPQGNVITKLTGECEAVCTWLVSFRRTDVQSARGLVPPKDMSKILEKLREIRERKPEHE